MTGGGPDSRALSTFPKQFAGTKVRTALAVDIRLMLLKYNKLSVWPELQQNLENGLDKGRYLGVPFSWQRMNGHNSNLLCAVLARNGLHPSVGITKRSD
jgi:hypothetical protein